MSDQIIAREISDGFWQWGLCDSAGHLRDGAYLSGDDEALRASLPSATTPVSVAMRGQKIVSTKVPLEAKQRKHAAKLIPYELEDNIGSSVDDLHFSFAPADEKNMVVLYTEAESCAKSLNALSDQGCDVRMALPDYLLLPRPENGVSFKIEAGIVSARLSEHWGFSVEQELAAVVLKRLALHSAFAEQAPESMNLVAGTEEELEQLQKYLPETWKDIPGESLIGDFWSAIDLSSPSFQQLNLRRGRLSRQLPLMRWWGLWKTSVIFLAVAFVFSIIANMGVYFSAKSEEKAVLENINAVYLDAVPNGRLGDVEGMLKSKLSSVRKVSAEPSNFVFLLSKVSELIAAKESIKLSNYSYSGDQRSLQLILEFATLSEMGDFRSALQSVGIESDSPRTSSVGTAYQARMKIQEAK